MSLANINIQLDQEAAQIYMNASEQKRKKLNLIMSLWLREFEK